MKSTALTLLSAACLLLSACNVRTESEVTVETGASASADDLITETRDVSDFNRVRLETLGDLNITQGDEIGVSLEYSPNYEGVIETEVRGGTLVISSNRRNMTQINRDVLRYDVTMPELEAVELDGSSDLNIGSFSAEEVLLAVDGSGDITAEDLQANGLELALGGSGEVLLGGRADTLVIGIDGSGKVEAQRFQAQEVRLGISGSGEVNVCAQNSLEVNIDGSGEVTYYGNPANPDVNILGSGEVEAGGACP